MHLANADSRQTAGDATSTTQTQRLYAELQHLLHHKNTDRDSPTPPPDTVPRVPKLPISLLANRPFGPFITSRQMPPKKGSKAALRDEGLERTNNDLGLSSWPHVQMINQKNYYTEYLKRDDQYLAYRTLQEENSNRLRKEALDRARNGMQVSDNGTPLGGNNMDVDDDGMDTAGDLNEPHGAKIIVIHPGSQNLRIGLANDALPKTVPMCIARKWKDNEAEGEEPAPKRFKVDNELPKEQSMLFGEDFKKKYENMTAELKQRMRMNKRRLLPLQRESLVHRYNQREEPTIIPEHNDPQRIDWTEIPPGKAPEYFTGMAALRLPEKTRPQYRLTWPIRHGWFNERDYKDQNLLIDDIFTIIEDALQTQLGLTRKDWKEYSCCFVIPDLYERKYVTLMLDGLMREFEFKKACFMQESLAASFGAGFSLACIVDIGAQKTSICCVEDGMCIEESRMNLKYGGWDVTELFVKMMLCDYFPYADINLWRRYDYLLAEELKHKFCTMDEATVTVQLYDFHLRAAGQDTRKYTFKTYDETMLAPLGLYVPDVFDHTDKLTRRHKVIDRSYDLYDGTPNDPLSQAQLAAHQYTRDNYPSAIAPAEPSPILQPLVTATPSKPKPFNLLSRLPQDDIDSTPRSSVAGSPAPEGANTPTARDSPGPDTPAPTAAANGTTNTTTDKSQDAIQIATDRDRFLPLMPIDTAILTSIAAATNNDERKTRDLLSTIMLVGGGCKLPHFHAFLETRLKEVVTARWGAGGQAMAEKVLVGLPPRDLDQQVVTWKGGSVFARLSASGNDSWVWGREYELLGGKLLAQKCMWNW